LFALTAQVDAVNKLQQYYPSCFFSLWCPVEHFMFFLRSLPKCAMRKLYYSAVLTWKWTTSFVRISNNLEGCSRGLDLRSLSFK